MPSPAPHPDHYLTRLADMFAAIVAHKAAHDGNSPTRRELGARLGLSTSMVQFYLLRLVEAGLLEWDGDSPRGFRVIGSRWQPPSPLPNTRAILRQVVKRPPAARARARGASRGLTEDERTAILRRLVHGEDAERLAAEYGISASAMSRLKKRLR